MVVFGIKKVGKFRILCIFGKSQFECNLLVPNLDHRHILVEVWLHDHPKEHLIGFYTIE